MKTKGIFLIACLAFLLHDVNCGIFKDLGCGLCSAKNEVEPDESAEAPVPSKNHQPAGNAPLPQSLQRPSSHAQTLSVRSSPPSTSASDSSSHVHHNPIQGSTADAHKEISIKRELPKELSNYQLLDKTFTDGRVSDVELAKNKETGEEVSLKAIKITSKIKTKSKQPQSEIKQIIDFARKEAEVLKYLPRHRNIVQFEHFVETDENLYLVMEYISDKNLYEYLKEKKLDENEARVIFKQVFEAIKHCHKHEVVHRDLKSENVLIDSNNNIKLIDFGFAHKLKQGELLKDRPGSPHFSAPEIGPTKERKPEYDGFKSDIWALGVILYELVCGPVWPGSNYVVDRVTMGYELSFPYNMPITEDAKDLMRNILKIDANKRFTLEQIIGHKWMHNTQSG